MDALLGQLTERDELIIVDNGSDDNTKEIVNSKILNNNVKYIYHSTSGKRGTSATRNRGIEAARGRYIAFLDDDAIPVEGWCDSVEEACQGLPDGWGGLTGQIIPRIEGEVPEWISARDLSSLTSRVMRGESVIDVTDNPWIVTANSVCKREALEDVEGFSEVFDIFGAYGEDIDLSYKMSYSGYKVFYHPHIKVLHQIPTSRLTQENLLLRRYVGAIGECLLIMRHKGLLGRSMFAAKQLALRPVYIFVASIKMLASMIKRRDKDVMYAKTRIARSRGFLYASVVAIKLRLRV